MYSFILFPFQIFIFDIWEIIIVCSACCLIFIVNGNGCYHPSYNFQCDCSWYLLDVSAEVLFCLSFECRNYECFLVRMSWLNQKLVNKDCRSFMIDVTSNSFNVLYLLKVLYSLASSSRMRSCNNLSIIHYTYIYIYF